MVKADTDLIDLLNENGCLCVLNIQMKRRLDRKAALKILDSIVKKHVNVLYATEGLIYIEGRLPEGMTNKEKRKKRKSKYKDIKKPKG